jgi:hypothetical protein
VVIWTALDSTAASIKAAELYWIDRVGTYNDIQADLENGRFKMTPEARAIAGLRNKTRGQTAEQRANMATHTSRRWEEASSLQRKALIKGFMPNPNVKGMAPTRSAASDAEHARHMKALWANPAKSVKLQARLDARWADPGARARQAEKIRAYHAARRAAD